MNSEIKQRIKQIKNGEIPKGYRYSRAGLCPNDWNKGVLSDVLYNVKRVIPKPKKSYWRIGIRSHAKGTFHEYIENPEMIDMDELYVVKENDLILNITFAWEHAVALADKNDDGLLVSHRFPTYVFCEGQNPFFYKNVVVQERFKEMLVQISPGGAGRNRVMSKKDFLKLPCNIPSCEEQQKIAEILMQCDKLIELYQNETDELQKLKKICFCKMFPKNGNDVPEWRFPQFTDAWEQRRFDEVFDCTVPNNTFSRAELSYDEGTVLNVHYGDVLIKYGSVLDVQKDDIPRIPNRCREDFNGALLQDGDVIIADTAEDETTGKACEIGNLQGRAIVSGLHTMVCRPRHRMALGYLGYYLNSNAYHHQLLPLMQGIKVLSLSRSNIQKTSVSYPTAVEEQQLIANYFSHLDNLITLHQRKLVGMKKQKKSLTQLLLTGIVRVSV